VPKEAEHVKEVCVAEAHVDVVVVKMEEEEEGEKSLNKEEAHVEVPL